jgi:nicotinamidase-related amidase
LSRKIDDNRTAGKTKSGRGGGGADPPVRRFLQPRILSVKLDIMILEPKKTAMLTLDLQRGILGMVPNSDACLAAAKKAVEFGRKSGFQIIHVGLGFNAGHPEIPDTQERFARIKQMNVFVKGTESAEFHPDVYSPGELIVYKQRVSGFTENELDMILRAGGIENLVFFGIATSGIVLSTLRRAFDLDYRCTVLKDACYDADEEVHRVLTEKVFTAQGNVVTVDEFIGGRY